VVVIELGARRAARGARAAGGLLRLGWTAALVAAFVTFASEVVNYAVLSEPSDVLEVAGNANAFKGASMAAIALALLAAIALASADGWDPAWQPASLALLLALFLVDDGVNIHDGIADRLSTDSRDALGLGAAALYVLALVVTLVFLRAAARLAHPRSAHALGFGLGLLVLAVAMRGFAVASHAGGHHFEDGPRALGVAAMQGSELAGWILVAAALGAARLLPATGSRA